MCFMFSGCEALRSLNIYTWNTENVIDMSFMFTRCLSLSSLDLISFNTKNVISTNDMFFNRPALTTIYCNSDWKVGGKVLDAREMFKLDTKLKGDNVSYSSNQIGIEMANTRTGYFTSKSREPYVVLSKGTLTFYYDYWRHTHELTGTIYSLPAAKEVPAWAGSSSNPQTGIQHVVFDKSFDMHRPTSTRSWFEYCVNLQDVKGIEYLNTAEVTDMHGMVLGCTALRSLDVTNFNTENAISMTNMFTSCSSLESIDLNNFNTAKVTDMSGMFRECNSLLTIYCNNDWKGDGTVGDVMMFLGCLNLKGTNIKYDSKKIGIDMANPTRGYFTSKTVGAEQVAYAVLTEADSTLTFYYDDLRITRSGTDYDMPAAGEMPGWAGTLFSPQKKIKLVVFDKSFADYRPNSTMSWFNTCTKLQTIEGMQYLNTEKVTNMSGMFATCLSLTSIDVSNFNTANVTSMSSMFSLCQALTTLDVSNFNIANVTNMSRMFFNSQFLNTIYCSDDWKEAGKVQSHDMMFLGCNNLKGNNALYNSTKTGIEMANPTTGYFTSKATGIDKMKADGKAGDGKTYDLSGRRVNESYKGIIIKNGKKYIQK